LGYVENLRSQGAEVHGLAQWCCRSDILFRVLKRCTPAPPVRVDDIEGERQNLVTRRNYCH